MTVYTCDAFSDNINNLGWSVGKYSYGVPHIAMYGVDGKLHIGKYCSIAGGVMIFLGGNHRPDWVTTYPFNKLDQSASHIDGHPATNGDVVIGNDVWIGQSVTIMSGVTIGNGACIAAGALVAKNVPPYTVVGGNPARVIKERFSKGQIDSLQKISWWDWPEEKIRLHYNLLLSGNIDDFINEAQAMFIGDGI